MDFLAYYAIPDIHGNLKGLKKAVQKVMTEFNPSEDTIVFLGDYIDRGLDSSQVLYYLKGLQERFPENIVCLKGNHDDMFLNYLDNQLEIAFLLNDTGLRTINSFVKDYFGLADLFLTHSFEIYDMASREDYTYKILNYIKKEHRELLDWYKELPLFFDKIEAENVLFIHAGIEEKMLGLDWKQYTSEKQMIWQYPPNYGMNPYGFNIVCGHVMTDEFWKFSDKPCYDIYVSGNHYYVDGASPMNEQLNILKMTNGKFYDYLSGKELI